MAKIETVEALRAIYPAAKGRSVTKQLDRIEKHGQRFVEAAPFLVLGSAGPDGLVDVSPKGDGPGFVHVLDERTLAMPDRPGNNRLDSFENLLANPGVALIFMIPGVEETYRVNGIAELRDDEALRARFEVNGKRPATVLLVHVREAYLHCAKALMRSKLWEPESWLAERPVAPMGEMIRDQTGGGTPESQAEMTARYREQLY